MHHRSPPPHKCGIWVMKGGQHIIFVKAMRISPWYVESIYFGCQVQTKWLLCWSHLAKQIKRHLKYWNAYRVALELHIHISFLVCKWESFSSPHKCKVKHKAQVPKTRASVTNKHALILLCLSELCTVKWVWLQKTWSRSFKFHLTKIGTILPTSLSYILPFQQHQLMCFETAQQLSSQEFLQWTMIFWAERIQAAAYRKPVLGPPLRTHTVQQIRIKDIITRIILRDRHATPLLWEVNKLCLSMLRDCCTTVRGLPRMSRVKTINQFQCLHRQTNISL